MTDRDRILDSIGPSSSRTLPPVFADSKTRSNDLWNEFQVRLEALKGKIATWDDLAALSGRHWIVEPGVQVPPQVGHYEPSSCWEADAGLTTCEVAVAETGSLLILHNSNDHRMASLAPPLHVVVVRSDQIVATLDEALLRLDNRNAVMITGPSRTADIEGVLVNGVHGPANLWVIVQEG